MLRDDAKASLTALGEGAEVSDEMVDEYVSRTITEKIAILIVAEENGLTPTDEEIDEYIVGGKGVDGADEYLGGLTEDERYMYEEQLTKNKVADFILTKAKETEPEAVR